MVQIEYPKKLRFRKRGLPRRVKRIAQGMAAACDIEFIEGAPKAKVIVFKSRAGMRRFYEKVLPEYGGTPFDKLGQNCCGVVVKLAVDVIPSRGPEYTEVDRRYFCVVLLSEKYLTAEILAHEAVHVGYAWDFRTLGDGKYFPGRENYEENVAYPAGIFVDVALRFIKEEKLREV